MITGVRASKQLVIVNGNAFQIKSIFGLAKPDELEDDQVEIQGQSAEGDGECTICLAEKANAIVMPCGHMCLCRGCGNELLKS